MLLIIKLRSIGTHNRIVFDSRREKRDNYVYFCFNGIPAVKRLNVDRIDYIETNENEWLLHPSLSCRYGTRPVIDIETQLKSSAEYSRAGWEIGAFQHSSFGFVDSQSSSRRRLNCFNKRLNI